MTKLIPLLLLISQLSFSQKGSIEILFEDETTVYTNWIKLKDSPFMKRPFITIDDEYGDRYRIKDIIYYKGFDQNSVYRYLEKIQLDDYPDGYRFTERINSVDSSSHVKLYNDRFLYSGIDFTSRSSKEYYSINDSYFKNINYRNVKNEESFNSIGEMHLKSAKNIQVFQYVSTSVGLLLLSKVIFDNTDPSDSEFINDNDNIVIFTGVALIAIPLSLRQIKISNLKYALRNMM